MAMSNEALNPISESCYDNLIPLVLMQINSTRKLAEGYNSAAT
jgi:hypothetical protein